MKFQVHFFGEPSKLQEIYHLASAIRACWGAEGHRDLVAQYFYDQVHPLGLKPNLVTFSNLAGAQWEAPVESILATYRQMQEFQLKPNEVFAEIYLLSVLQKPYGTLWETWHSSAIFLLGTMEG